MGVLSRRRSLLVKLIVVVTTAWFTIAFLLYTDNQGRQQPQQPQEVALPLRQDDRINEVEVPEKMNPFKEDMQKREANVAVLAPPQSQHGEMGKPVVLPANMSGKFDYSKKKKYAMNWCNA